MCAGRGGGTDGKHYGGAGETPNQYRSTSSDGRPPIVLQRGRASAEAPWANK